MRNVLWDSGLGSGPLNLALDRRQRAWSRWAYQPCCRLHRTRSTASLGAHEEPRHALRFSYCREMNIPVVRRLTGGGAWYLDPDQRHATWTWAATGKADDHEVWLPRLGEALASGLRWQGIAAEFVWPNNLEAAGRKLGVIGMRLERDVAVAQLSILIGVDVETMLKVLRVPREKLTPEGLSGARDRLVTVRELIGDDNPWARVDDALASATGVMFDAPVTSCRQSISWVGPVAEVSMPSPPSAWEAFAATPGGVVYATLCQQAGRVRQLRLTGALHVTPPELLERLDEHVRGRPLGELAAAVQSYLTGCGGTVSGVGIEDLVWVTELALAREEQSRALGLDLDEANTVMVHDPKGDGDVTRLLDRSRVVLVPYCAKPTWCKWRHREGCPECGQCQVGDVYRMARERGLEAITIVNFEHLRNTLDRLADTGTPAYLGMCCRNFFIKRHYAFREAGVPAVLMDISGSNCYELGQEEAAYRGEFRAQAELNGAVVEKVMRFVPLVESPLPRRGRRRGDDANRA